MAENKWVTGFFQSYKTDDGPLTYLCLFFGDFFADSTMGLITKNHHLWENTLDGTNPAPVDRAVYPIIYTVSSSYCLGFLPTVLLGEFSGCQPAKSGKVRISKSKHL